MSGSYQAELSIDSAGVFLLFGLHIKSYQDKS